MELIRLLCPPDAACWACFVFVLCVWAAVLPFFAAEAAEVALEWRRLVAEVRAGLRDRR